jgi:hypothetical protein
MKRLAIALIPCFALASCGQPAGDDASGVGGVSSGEASALNEAAATLDARSQAAQPQGGGLNPAAVTAARADRERTPVPAGQEPSNASH